MTTANLDESPSSQSVPRFRRPADYYSAPSPDPAFPPLVTFGCGGLALLVLLLVFAAGVFLSRGGFTEGMDLILGMMMGEIRGMYEPDVTDAQKKALETEMETLRQNLRNEKISVAALDPLMKTMRKAIADEKLTGAEIGSITDVARRINTTPWPNPSSKPSSSTSSPATKS